MGFGYSKTQFSWKEAFRGMGGLIFIVVLLLLLIGLLFIFSASPKKGAGNYVNRQLIWVGISLVAFFITVRLDYLAITKYSYWIYFVGIFFLLATTFLGTYRGGAKRWLQLGPALLQTSEIMKIAIIFILARILSEENKKNGGIRELLYPVFITAIPMGLIVIQPDLGTSLVFIPIAFSMIFASGIRFKALILVFIIMVNLAVVVYFYGLHEYQRKRVLTFMNQDSLSQEDKRGSGYHLEQSKIAIGSGHLTGKGWRKGTQNIHGLLPERHTDFIFAIVGEEAGFLGVCFVLLLYLILFCSMLVTAYTTIAVPGQLIIIGVMALLLTQTIVNTAMTVGMAPITGLPLPFFSYGGSSLLFNFISVGMVVSVAGRKIV